MLISRDAARPPIDWQFTPRAPDSSVSNQSLSTITLPARFVGRRKELRAVKNRLLSGQSKQLLITGPGGQGKTKLAGKVAQDFQQRGYRILAWSARPQHHWRDFQFELELMLDEDNAKRYDRAVVRCENESKKADLLLRLLLSQYPSRLVLFFDNLESIQQPDSLALANDRTRGWIEVAQALSDQGLILLLTSRWQLPGWPDADHWALHNAGYGDFLHFARQQQHLPAELGRSRERLRRLYDTLHGNFRGLELFISALQGMTLEEEDAFLGTLAQAEGEIQTDMALETIIEHRSAAERALLQRLPAYQTPVPIEGVIKIALDMEAPERLLRALLKVSLVERRYADDLRTEEYQCSPLVADWLRKQGTPPPDQAVLRTVAEYQSYLFRNERKTLGQAVIAYKALLAANQQADADRFALDRIIGRLSLDGFYQTLLQEWLPAICRSDDHKPVRTR